MSSRLKVFQEESVSTCGRSVALNVLDPSDAAPDAAFRGRAAVVTLGCAKNQVDSEVMLGVLRNRGFEIVTDLTSADVAIVNTCGFLQSSVQESIDCILEVAELKRSARLRRLIVAGCAVERYKGDIRQALPEVDSFLTIDDILQVGAAAEGNELGESLERAARPYFLYDDSMPRYLSTRGHTAYIKVAEGCNRPCTFCIIPKLRGAMRSRSIESVVREARALGAQGVREINLVAQDLTAYGKDLKSATGNAADLAELLEALDASAAVDWIRLLYAYPIGIDKRLLDSIVALPSICNYLDLPLQHVSVSVLQRMQRPVGRYAARNIIEFIRSTAPQIALRTTFIVGFPGEREEDIDELERFIREGHFSSVGIFTYSPEEGTPSASMDGQISEARKRARRERLMLAQQDVNAQRLRDQIGKTVDVLVEGLHEETDLLLSARTRFQAPEVDGTVIINELPFSDAADDTFRELIGTICSAEINDVSGYDLVGRIVQCRPLA